MASLITIRRSLLVIVIVCSVVICCTIAEDCDYEPHVGALGKHPEKGSSGDKDQGSDKGDKDPSPADGGDKDQGSDKGDKDPSPADGGDKDSGPPSGEDSGSGEGDKDPEGGAIENDPAHIVANALLCFNAKEIYCSCKESYRLSESGEFHVPHDRVEEFCNGPCLQETKLVLNCIEGIMGHFTFFNKATTQDVRDTVLAACANGETRGDLNVARHVKEKEGKDEEGKDESIGCKGTVTFVFNILATFIAQLCFLVLI